MVSLDRAEVKVVPAALLHALPHYNVLCSGRVHQLPLKPLVSIVVYPAPGHNNSAFKTRCALLATHLPVHVDK